MTKRLWLCGLLAVIACRDRAKDAATGSSAGSGSSTGSAAAPTVMDASTGDDAGGSATGGSATASAADPATAPVVKTIEQTAPTVTLSAPGAEPRAALTYAPRGGERSVVVTFTSGPEDAPPDLGMAIAVAMRWRAPAAAMQPYTFAVTESRAVPPASASGGEARLMGGIGAMYTAVAGRLDVDAHGRGRLGRTSETIPTQPSILVLLHPLIVPLPSEPVGVGAHWKATQRLTMTAEGTSTRTYELVQRDGDTLTIRVSGQTTWPKAGPSGEDLVETLAGSLVVGLAEPLARSGRVTTTLSLGPAKLATVVDLATRP